MKAVSAIAIAGLAGLASAASVAKRDASQHITVQGNAFMAGGSRFYIRGVDYQPGGSSQLVDPLADENSDACQRDIKNFQDLGLNTIRVYSVDNSAGHDKCMKALKDAGIYLILDVNTPTAALNRDQPAKSYNPTYLQNIFATIDMFAKYDNTMAFFSGNEVINDTQASTQTAPYIKAVTRDMKSYIASRKYRAIPVGYSAADVSSNRYETAEFLNCGTDDERSDFFAFNDYSWCDPSSFTTSGWDQKVKLFSNYSIPIFLSEYGCNTNARKWEEVKALYSTDMTPVYSGGLVYEYSNEANNYGLGDISGGSFNPNDDYKNLKAALQGTPLPSGDGGAKMSGGSPSTCPATSKTWGWGNDSLPALPSGAKQYMTNGAGKGLGLKLFSMDAGGQSTTWANTGSGTGGNNQNTGSSSSSASTSKSAGPMTVPEFSFAPLILAGVWAAGSLLGGSFMLL